MRPEVFDPTICSERSKSLTFFMYINLVVLPGVCAYGYTEHFLPRDRGMGCRTPLQDVHDIDSEDSDGNYKVKRQWCTSTNTYRAPNSFCESLPTNLTPTHYFAEVNSLKKVAKASGASPKNTG